MPRNGDIDSMISEAVDDTDGVIGELFECIRLGFLCLIMEIFDNEYIDVDCIDMHDNTPLHISCEYNHQDLVSLLIDKGADIDYRNMNDETPLVIAIKNGHVECAKILIENGADVTDEKLLQITKNKELTELFCKAHHRSPHLLDEQNKD